MKLNILQICPRLPYPLTDGAAIGIFNITKYLALRGHKITLITFSRDDVKDEDLAELKKYCKLMVVDEDTRNTFGDGFLNLFSSLPYTIAKYRKKEMERKIRTALRENKYDVVHIDHLQMASYTTLVKKEFNLPVVLREHNVDTTILERAYREQKNPLIKIYIYLQYKKLYPYQTQICEEFDKCIMITEEDNRRIREANSRVKTCVIPAGVDITYFDSLPEVEEESSTLVFVGIMAWFPNADGILWFCKEILPLIRQEIPQVKLYIVGSEPSPQIRSLANENVIVTGFVEDVREYIAKGTVFIVPLRIGGGIRIKILNTLAMGKAIVSTSVGAEGIEVTDGENILIADNPKDFASQTVRLLRDEHLRQKLGDNGRRVIREKYLWDTIAEKFKEVYQEVIKSRQLNSKG